MRCKRASQKGRRTVTLSTPKARRPQTIVTSSPSSEILVGAYRISLHPARQTRRITATTTSGSADTASIQGAPATVTGR